MARRRSAPTAPDVDDRALSDPTEYRPRSTSPSVEATKDLLKWMRAEGFGAQNVVVSGEGVQILGLEDHYPRKAIDKILGRDRGGGGEARSPREGLEEFATDEEITILGGGS